MGLMIEHIARRGRVLHMRCTFRLPRPLQLRLVANDFDAVDWPWPSFRSAFPFDQDRETNREGTTCRP